MNLVSKVILTLFLLFPYTKITMWKYALATFATLVIFKKSSPGSYKEKLGLNFSRKQIPWGILVFIICAALTETFVQSQLAGGLVVKESPEIFGLWIFQPFFQSLNEEMILRALFLWWLFEKLKNYPAYLSHLVMALLFSLSHFLFCYVLFGIHLDPMAGLALFLGTLILNILFDLSGSILFSWAVHFGINFSFFGGTYLKGGILLNDAEKFNLIYSSASVSLFLTALLAATLIACVYRRKIQFSQN